MVDAGSVMETACLTLGCLCETYKVQDSEQGEYKCNSLKINRMLTERCDSPTWS